MANVKRIVSVIRSRLLEARRDVRIIHDAKLSRQTTLRLVVLSVTVRLHDSIQEENFHYLVFDL